MTRIWVPTKEFLLRVYSVKIRDAVPGWEVRARADGDPKQPRATLFYQETAADNLPDMNSIIRVRLDDPPCD